MGGDSGLFSSVPGVGTFPGKGTPFRSAGGPGTLEGRRLARATRPISQEFREQRQQDLTRGRARGEEIFGGEALGRVRETRTGDIGDVISQRRQQFEQGLDAPAFEASRERRLRELQRQEQGAQRQLRGQQGRFGVGGPLAAAQFANLSGQQDINRRGAEQELLLQDVGLRREALGGFERSVQAAEGDELARQQANQANLRRELLGIQSRELGEASLGAAERGAAGQILTGQSIANSGSQGGGKKGGGGGGKK
jgi:hypothetical protein